MNYKHDFATSAMEKMASFGSLQDGNNQQNFYASLVFSAE